ncbi:unnamed protein product, partial [Didymodactylos carnosus]
TWLKQFKFQDTRYNMNFYLDNGTITKLTMMYQKQKYPYYNDTELKVRIIHIPYKSIDENRFVFTILLPYNGIKLSDIEENLLINQQKLLMNNAFSIQELLLYLPKFKMECQFQLSEILSEMGMTDAFDIHKADFSNIDNEKNNLYITKVIHKACIEVNEQGSEAAAATAVIFTRGRSSTIRHPPPVEFTCDHPFLFMIREEKRNITLFTGRFTTKP